tara:strand:+ start:432 stop:617 length:186 start_codon:yes stop_codon:yes gene_type:complete
MKKFEYKRVDQSEFNDLAGHLGGGSGHDRKREMKVTNDLGKHGWELVAVFEDEFFYKREIK